MKIRNVFIILLVSLHIIKSIKVEVEFDEIKDIIFKDGKMYLSINNATQLKGFNNRQLSHEETHEEISSSGYWFYIFLIICKFLN